MKTKANRHRQSGFSLTEILVVIVIIGVLVLLAMPKFSSVIIRAKTTEARIMLKHVHTLQRAYFYEHDRYCPDLPTIGFEPQTLISDGGEARYRIEITRADASVFVARAVAVVDFDHDGEFNVWEVDERGQIHQVVAD